MPGFSGSPSDDVFTLTGPVAQGDVFDGGDGIDTLIVANGLPNTSFANATLTGFENIQFGTASGTQQIGVTGSQVAGITAVTGTAATNIFLIQLPFGGGAFQVPALTLNSWSASDQIVVVGSPVMDNQLSAVDGVIGRQVLVGGGGNDLLIGSDGADVLIGGNGGDVMTGGLGDDVFSFSNTGQFLADNHLADLIDGGDGLDAISSSGIITVRTVQNVEVVALAPPPPNAPGLVNILTFDDDTLCGDLFVNGRFSGNGQINVNVTSGAIDASGITIGAGSNLRFGFFGTTDADTMTGTAMNDTFDANGGADTLTGGAGDDTYNLFNSSGAVLIEAAGGGTDRVVSDQNYTLAANFENLTVTTSLVVGQPVGTPKTIIGTGNIGANEISVMTGFGIETQTLAQLNGLGGDDTLIGHNGSDVLRGGRGNDTMMGGDGSDFYVVTDAGDVVIDLGTFGFDVVNASIDYVLTDGVERLILTGTATSGTGNAGANNLNGSALANMLDGAGGNDTIQGRGGDDMLLGGDGNDILDGGDGRDLLTGGSGADRFAWRGADFAGMTAADADRIVDFSQADSDRIDLRTIDAITGGDNDRFTFIGTDAFGSVAGELRYTIVGSDTIVEGDLNGDGQADFAIALTGAVTLVAGDFLL